MYLLNLICSLVGLVAVCLAAAALILAIGGNLACGVERAEPGIVLVVCKSPAFGGNPNVTQ